MGSLNWASGLIPLGRFHVRPLQRHFHPLGLTNRFTPQCRSYHLVLEPSGTSRTYHFSHQEDLSGLSRWSSRFSRTPLPRAGAPTWGFPDFGCFVPLRTQALHQCAGAQSGNIGYSHPDETYSGLPQCDSRPSISAEPAHHNRLEPPPRKVKQIFGMWGTPAVDMFSTVHNTHLPQFMPPVPDPRALAIDALSHDWQERSMYMFPPFLLLSKISQKLRTTQEGEVILVRSIDIRSFEHSSLVR